MPSTPTFTLPDPKVATYTSTFLKSPITLEEAFIGAYLAAAPACERATDRNGN
jgi:hypothetical protein